MAISSGKGTTLKIGDGMMSEAFTEILNVTDIKEDGTTVDFENTTSNDSSDPVKTSAPTLYDNGTIKFVITYDPTKSNHVQLKTLRTSLAACNFQIIRPNSIESNQFQGYIQQFQFDTNVAGLNKANVTIKINGAFTDI